MRAALLLSLAIVLLGADFDWTTVDPNLVLHGVGVAGQWVMGVLGARTGVKWLQNELHAHKADFHLHKFDNTRHVGTPAPPLPTTTTPEQSL